MPPPDLLYCQTHLWVSCEDDTVTIGVTEYGLEQYGDVVAVEVAEANTELTHGEPMGELECMRGVWELYAPLDGRVVELNGVLVRHPEHVNEDPYGEGWLLHLKLRDRQHLDHLLTCEEYETLAEKQVELEADEEEEEEDEFNLLGS